MTMAGGGGMEPGYLGLRVASMETLEQASDRVAAKKSAETLRPSRVPGFINPIDVVIERQVNKSSVAWIPASAAASSSRQTQRRKVMYQVVDEVAGQSRVFIDRPLFVDLQQLPERKVPDR